MDEQFLVSVGIENDFYTLHASKHSDAKLPHDHLTKPVRVNKSATGKRLNPSSVVIVARHAPATTDDQRQTQLLLREEGKDGVEHGMTAELKRSIRLDDSADFHGLDA